MPLIEYHKHVHNHHHFGKCPDMSQLAQKLDALQAGLKALTDENTALKADVAALKDQLAKEQPDVATPEELTRLDALVSGLPKPTPAAPTTEPAK